MTEESIDLLDALEMVDNPIIWKNKGDDFFKKGKFEDAIRCYTYAVELKPDFIDAWSGMGTSFLKLGRDEESKKCTEKMKQIQAKF